MPREQDQFELRCIEAIRTKRERIAAIESEIKGINEALSIYEHNLRNPIKPLSPERT